MLIFYISFSLLLGKAEEVTVSPVFVIVIAAIFATILIVGMVILAMCVCKHQKERHKVQLVSKPTYNTDKENSGDDKYFSELDRNPDVVPETSGEYQKLTNHIHRCRNSFLHPKIFSPNLAPVSKYAFLAYAGTPSI